VDSAFAKLGRAKVHRDHLVAEIEAFDSADPLDWKFIEVEPLTQRFPIASLENDGLTTRRQVVGLSNQSPRYGRVAAVLNAVSKPGRAKTRGVTGY
jgi:hypothetical protein